MKHVAALAVLVLLAGGCALSQTMTVPKVVGACRTPGGLSGAGMCGPTARNAICDDYGNVLYTQHPDMKACRDGCQKVVQAWFSTPNGMTCGQVLDRGASLCKQYCNGLYGPGGNATAPVRDKPYEPVKLPGIPEVTP